MTNPRVHLLTPHLLPGDAVSCDVLGMLSWFRRRGLAAEVYAERVHPTFKNIAQPIGAYERHAPARDDVMVCHHSGGWPLGLAFWRQTRNRRVFRFHNVTPPWFYRTHCPRYADSCRLGEEQTGLMLRLETALRIPNSEFSAQTLERIAPGPRCRVVPPFHAIDALENEPPDLALAEQLHGGINLLFVGRVAPNKGFHHLVRVVGLLRRSFNVPARLFAIGGLDPNLRSYHDELFREIADRGLTQCVHFTGKASPRQLATYYRASNFFLCLSEHEGFCVPLVEAMAFRLPIVAYGGGAVSSTLGDQCLCWDTLDPLLIAESICRIHEKPYWSESLIRRQRDHYDLRFSGPAVEQLFAEAMGEVLDSSLIQAPGKVTARNIPAANGIADAGDRGKGRSPLHGRKQRIFQR
jgi:glycosyltransferase involved in cell wall biosynthesis